VASVSTPSVSPGDAASLIAGVVPEQDWGSPPVRRPQALVPRAAR
jgi:hypothetical protein